MKLTQAQFIAIATTLTAEQITAALNSFGYVEDSIRTAKCTGTATGDDKMFVFEISYYNDNEGCMDSGKVLVWLNEGGCVLADYNFGP